jgi:PleD family two-component response regulator
MDTMLEITTARLMHTAPSSRRWCAGARPRARAVTDPATGLFNRRYMDESLEATLNRSRVEGKRAVAGHVRHGPLRGHQP